MSLRLKQLCRSDSEKVYGTSCQMIPWNASLLVSLVSAGVVGDVNIHVLLQLRDPEIQITGKPTGTINVKQQMVGFRFVRCEGGRRACG